MCSKLRITRSELRIFTRAQAPPGFLCAVLRVLRTAIEAHGKAHCRACAHIMIVFPHMHAGRQIAICK